MIAKDHATEAGHWYTRDGEPMYTVPSKKDGSMRNTTLADARKLDLVPSVTTILNVAVKPSLTNWLQEQVLLAALTLPKVDGEEESVYIRRIMQDSKAQGRDAADLGTEIHAAIQGFYEGRKASKFPHHVESCNKVIIEHFGAQNWICERSFSHEIGFGGKVDMHTNGIVVDIKTKDFKEKTKLPLYDEHLMQLAAYRVGLGMPYARCANVFVSRTNPDMAVISEWEAEDLDRGWEMFVSLLRFWQLKNQHN